MVRLHCGELGRDWRGLWLRDPDTGVRARLGLTGPELAAALAGQGDLAAARQALGWPHFGFMVAKEF